MSKLTAALVHPPGYAPDIVKRATSALGRAYSVSPCAQRDEVRKRLSEARCVVLLDPDRCHVFDSWRDGGIRIPPVVFVTPDDDVPPSPIPALAAHVRERLPIRVLDHDLLRMATKAIAEDMYSDLPRRVHGSQVLSRHPLLERAVLLAVEERLKSVQSVARALGCSVRHLEREWHDASEDLTKASGAALPTLKRLLRQLLLLRALMAWLGPRHLRPTWTRVAEDLGVHPRTLQRLVQEMAKKLPSRLEIEDVPALLGRVEGEVILVLR